MTIHWEPTQFPEAVGEHYRTCESEPCPHTLEWFAMAPERVVLSQLGTHFTFGRWFRPGQAHRGLAFGLGSPELGLAYGAWGPDQLALRLRNDLLEMWPLDKYPVQP